MSYKSIANTDMVNLQNCEDEPIHIPGSIQPHGFLLAVDSATKHVRFCSGNISQFLGHSHEQVLKKTLQELFTPEQYDVVTTYLKKFKSSYSAPMLLKLGDRMLTCLVHLSGDLQVLEFEAVSEQQIAVSDVYQQTHQFTFLMESAGSLQQLAQLVAEEVRKTTEFDRVMVYKFDGDHNGHVIAESRKDDIEPFFDLHYPASDIPAQARALYLKNLLRIIVDVNYDPVPIFTAADNPEKNLDLTHSVLRSVSPIHVQYLKNMGVNASMSVSLVHEQRLWGLIACHHHSPKFIPGDLRLAAQLQGHFFTSQITVRERAEEYQIALGIEHALNDMLGKLATTEKISFNELILDENLLRLTNASGVVLSVNNRVYSSGVLPGGDDIHKLLNWLMVYSPSASFSTSNLTKIYPDAAAFCDKVSGVTFHSLGSGNGNCIVWCRNEVVQDVKWGGRPDEKDLSPGAGSLTPRKSFEIWSETKRCHATPWANPEIQAATNFAHSLQRHVHMAFLQKEEAKQRQLNTRLLEANAELENLYWIGSHDLKEPLRKIQLFASRIIDERDPADIEMIFSSVKRMNNSAKRMQLLIADILAYSKLSKSEEGFKIQDLNLIIQAVSIELQTDITDKNATIQTDGLPTINGISSFLQQLFVNIFRNSLKFARPGIAPLITVKYDGLQAYENGDPEIKYHQIRVVDNGIGFEPQYSEAIFKVFTRLHTQSEYPGSGVGLALCRKIMTNHNGFIRATSSAGEGTSIELYFPDNNAT
jgi:chemotaxis family two-component system sensor kinase Cph1